MRKRHPWDRVTMLNPYDPPETAEADAAAGQPRPWSRLTILVVGLLLPGLPSLMMRGSLLGAALLAAIPFAFALFGPVWDLVLFPHSSLSELGLYPFLATCGAIPLLSVWCGFLDRRRLTAPL